MTKKIIIITYESGKKEAIKYQLDALEFIETNFAFIVNVEIIDVLECDTDDDNDDDNDTNYQDELMPDTSNYDGDWQPYRSSNR